MSEASNAPFKESATISHWLKKLRGTPSVVVPAAETPPPPKITKEQALARLREQGYEIDAEIIIEFADLFSQALKKQNKHGTLHLAGGIINEPLPRDDIDMFVTFPTGQEITATEDPQEAIESYRRDFIPFITTMLQQTGFVITEEVEPSPHRDYDNLLRHNGWATIKPAQANATPIDLNANPSRELDHERINPAILLSEV